jgi:hypothetical protein
MVNAPLPEMVSRRFTAKLPCKSRAFGARSSRFAERRHKRRRAFAQILGKLYFFELRENLRRILFDYAQKRSGRANAAFNGPC